jgi:AraC family transcriptional regulator, transcriptional activator of pobA
MANQEPYRVQSISELHHLFGLPRPAHPLISVVDLKTVNRPPQPENRSASRVFDFYTISLKKYCQREFRYGQHQYSLQDNFAEEVMYFMAPGQVFGTIKHAEPSVMSGWSLYIHPDFFWKTPLAKSIKKYEYFDYSVHEALALTEKEDATIVGLMQNIQSEYLANMDNFSQDIIISLLEVLLNYADRFYRRQFLTRKKENHQVLDRLEEILNNYFDSDSVLTQGLPSVQYIAGELNLSPNYLSSLLKVLTGRNTLQHIQDKMISKAKEKISTTELSVSEISYALGFDHPQSFSRLFKTKTGLSPLAFRQTFN